MEMQPLRSTAIQAVGYDPATQTLVVYFHGRPAPVHHEGVPASVHRDLLGAASAGGYYNQHIRNRFPLKSRP